MARKKKPKTFSRRSRTGFDKAPTKTFRHLSEYVRTELDKKLVVQKIKKYIRENFKKQEQKLLLGAPDWAYAVQTPMATGLHWSEQGGEFPDKWDQDKVERVAIDYIRLQAEKKLAEDDSDKPKVNIKTRSPMEIVKDRTEDFIGEIESTIDQFDTGVDMDWENYSVYNELQKVDAPYNMAKGVYDFYKPLENEIRELVEKKTKDLVEAYGHWSVPKQKQYLSILERIVSDAERFMESKKAVRKVRKPKVKSADKQVEKVQYLRQSNEYKLTSIHPTQIVGARRVYLFNVKDRTLTELVSHLRDGFEVSGTTIKGIDTDQSRQTKLRKPDEFIPIVQKKTPNQIDKEWKKLTTKDSEPNGRVNKYTVIMRALDK